MEANANNNFVYIYSEKERECMYIFDSSLSISVLFWLSFYLSSHASFPFDLNSFFNLIKMSFKEEEEEEISNWKYMIE